MSTERWTIDPACSSVAFHVLHMMLAKVRGEFTRFSGFIDYDAESMSASRVEVSIDAASVDTREPERDAHLRSPDFLDAERFPTITFASTAVERDAEGVRVAGKLTIHGVAREVRLHVELLDDAGNSRGSKRMAFRATTVINRRDFGLVWNRVLESGGPLVGDAIEIELDVQAVKAA